MFTLFECFHEGIRTEDDIEIVNSSVPLFIHKCIGAHNFIGRQITVNSFLEIDVDSYTAWVGDP